MIRTFPHSLASDLIIAWRFFRNRCTGCGGRKEQNGYALCFCCRGHENSTNSE